MSWKVTNLEKIESTAALGQRVEEHTRVGLTEKKKKVERQLLEELTLNCNLQNRATGVKANILLGYERCIVSVKVSLLS